MKIKGYKLFLESNQDINSICNHYNIKNYTINDDGLCNEYDVITDDGKVIPERMEEVYNKLGLEYNED